MSFTGHEVLHFSACSSDRLIRGHHDHSGLLRWSKEDEAETRRLEGVTRRGEVAGLVERAGVGGLQEGRRGDEAVPGSGTLATRAFALDVFVSKVRLVGNVSSQESCKLGC